jgi:hypothetical protein
MASRRGPSQAKEDAATIQARIASQSARLQAVADANRKNIAQQNREREEAEAAKAAAVAAAKAARNSARTPTPPPPFKSPQKAPTYSAMGATPRSRTSTPPKRTTIDPWRMSPSSRAEPFILVGFTSSDFPDVEVAILPKGNPNSRLSSTSATRTQQPVETGAS